MPHLPEERYFADEKITEQHGAKGGPGTLLSLRAGMTEAGLAARTEFESNPSATRDPDPIATREVVNEDE